MDINLGGVQKTYEALAGISDEKNKVPDIVGVGFNTAVISSFKTEYERQSYLVRLT